MAQYKLCLNISIQQNCAIFILTNLCMLWKPQDLWEEENALEKNPGLTGHCLLRWCTNLGVRLALFVAPGVVGCWVFKEHFSQLHACLEVVSSSTSTLFLPVIPSGSVCWCKPKQENISADHSMLHLISSGQQTSSTQPKFVKSLPS